MYAYISSLYYTAAYLKRDRGEKMLANVTSRTYSMSNTYHKRDTWGKQGMTNTHITINGKRYDSVTGLPIAEPLTVHSSADKKQPIQTAPSYGSKHHSHTLHSTAQKSHTLNRTAVTRSKPSTRITVQDGMVTRSSSVTRFAPRPDISSKPHAASMSDIGPQPHPHMARVHASRTLEAKQHAQPQKSSPSSRQIKERALADAIRSAPEHTFHEHKQPRSSKHARRVTMASGAVALLLLAGYFTYINMPNLSVRVAAAQAGINANYPEYRPNGYRLDGPIAYQPGEVSMTFTSNSGSNDNFKLTQTKSSWDSSAVRDNFVKEKAGTNYLAYQERGLTIYTYDTNAAWVNGGILYTLSGNAPLSSDQVRRIATSL